MRKVLHGLLLCAAGAVMAGCGAGGARAGAAAAPASTSARAAIRAGDPGRSSEQGAILSAWRAALSAIDTAARTADWRSAAIRATHVMPQLGIVEHNLLAMHLDGEVATGHDRLLWARVVSIDGTTAEVVGCVSGDEIGVFAATGRPVPGIAGEAGKAGITSTMLLTSSGWKLERQSGTEGTCRPS
ncbi:MAG: hypothetical protein ACYCTL_01315 [Acidimicrobiales bacterium]